MLHAGWLTVGHYCMVCGTQIAGWNMCSADQLQRGFKCHVALQQVEIRLLGSKMTSFKCTVLCRMCCAHHTVLYTQVEN